MPEHFNKNKTINKIKVPCKCSAFENNFFCNYSHRQAVKLSLPPSGSAQASQSGRKVQSWPLTQRQSSSGIWSGRGGRLRGRRDAVFRWRIARLFNDWWRWDIASLSNRPLKSSQGPLSKSLQVGLERRGLLLQGEETLLHFVKLRAWEKSRESSCAPANNTRLFCFAYLLNVGLKQQLRPDRLAAAAHAAARMSVTPR